MKTMMVILGGLLSVIADTAQADTLPPYQATYLAGIESFERGEFQAASESFFQAIRQAPDPVEQLDEYLPYIYLSATRFEMGRTREARDALIQSQVFGVAPRTETGKLLLNRYAVEIMSASLDEPKTVLPQQSGLVNSRSLTLSDNEADLIRAQVLKSYTESSELADSKRPWYFYYEFGFDLLEAGDAQRALDSFIRGVNLLQKSERGKRMYGMWFIDYLPYYQIALANAKLGDWENARNAIRVSQDFGEFTSADPDYDAFVKLDQLITSQFEHEDS